MATAGTPSPLRIVPHTKPLYFHEGRLYCARYDRIVSTADYGQTFREEARLEIEMPLRALIGMSRLGQRVARAEVYRMRVLPDGAHVYIFRGGIYVRRPGERTASITFRVTRGSRPVSLAVSSTGVAVFGVYWANDARDAVHVFGSRDGGATWDVVFTFAPGEIRHVHGITFDRWENCFWICTGDIEAQCRLLRATPDFSDVRDVRRGGQGNRFYSLLVTERDVITATDTPLEENHVCAIDKRSGELRRLAKIENSNFYSCRVDGAYYVSTNVEPSPINDLRACHVWRGSADGLPWSRVLTFPIDALMRISQLRGVPQGLFQYGQLAFPDGDNPSRVLVCWARGLRGLDDAMVCFDAGAWDRAA